MRTAILRRLTLAAITVIAGGLISATLVRYAPGFGTDERQLDARLSSDSIQAIRNANSEERNILHFYSGCIRRALHGDFGESGSLNRPVRQLLQERAPVTLAVAGGGLALAWGVAALAVLIAWLFRISAVEFTFTTFSRILLCLPAGVLALLSVLVSAPGYLAIALIVFPKVFRYLSNLVAGVRQMPHIITAYAKGVSEPAMFFRHVVPVVKREVLALAGVSIGIAISAAIPVEALCGIPGIGQLAWQSALARDLPLLINISMLVIACVVLANSGADLLSEERRQPV
ncbi:MAG: ABC transporter permease [Candidatus Korobacteraceae bacterium]